MDQAAAPTVAVPGAVGAGSTADGWHQLAVLERGALLTLPAREPGCSPRTLTPIRRLCGCRVTYAAPGAAGANRCQPEYPTGPNGCGAGRS